MHFRQSGQRSLMWPQQVSGGGSGQPWLGAFGSLASALHGSTDLSDVVLLPLDDASTGARFHAHRFILAAHSPPLRAMLSGPLIEGSSREVAIGEKPAVLAGLLDFLYTGKGTVRPKLSLP